MKNLHNIISASDVTHSLVYDHTIGNNIKVLNFLYCLTIVLQSRFDSLGKDDTARYATATAKLDYIAKTIELLMIESWIQRFNLESVPSLLQMTNIPQRGITNDSSVEEIKQFVEARLIQHRAALKLHFSASMISIHISNDS